MNIKIIKDVYYKTGFRFDWVIDILKNEKIDLKTIILINKNCLSFNIIPGCIDLRFLNKYKQKTKKKFIEKYKILLTFFLYLCDEKRFKYLKKDLNRLNSSRFIILKFLYSLMNNYEFKLQNMLSILWFVSLGKTLIDVTSYKDGKSISERIEKSFDEKTKKLWKKWSKIIKNPKKNPYLENNIYRLDLLFSEIITSFGEFPKKIIETIIEKNKNIKINKVLNYFLKLIIFIDDSNLDEIIPLKKKNLKN